MSRYVLERSQFIPREVEEVFEFFSDASNLEAITPPFLNFHILSPAHTELQQGTLIDYRIRLYGMPHRWRTRIERWDPPHCFVDVQISGPYRYWRHTHTFRAVPGGTEIDDRVEYDLPVGPVGWLAHAVLVRRTLNRIFDYRQRRIAELLEAST